jgi:hypothetical protein
VFYELLQKNEYSDISDSEYSSDSEINVKISSGCEQSVSSDEAENISNNSSMQPDVWANSGAERPRFPFTGKPGINVDLEDPLEYFELFSTPNIAEITARETNRYAQTFLENMPNLKLKSRTHHRKETNRIEIMKLLAFFLLQGLHQKPGNKSCFSQRKILEMLIFLELFSRRSFHLLLKFLHFVDNESYDEPTCSSKRLYKVKLILDHSNTKFRSVYTPECNVSVDESLMMWKGRLLWKVYIPSKRARFGIKSFELCEAKSSYVWNFIIYIGQYTIFTVS